VYIKVETLFTFPAPPLRNDLPESAQKTARLKRMKNHTKACRPDKLEAPAGSAGFSRQKEDAR